MAAIEVTCLTPESQITVFGIGPDSLDDMIDKLAVNFAYNRSLLGIDTNIDYAQTVYENSMSIIMNGEDYNSNNVTLYSNIQPVFAVLPFYMPKTKDIDTEADVISFPLLAGAIVMIYNLPGINKVTLSLNVIALIYSGKIKYWDNELIQAINLDVPLPHHKIRPVARSDLAGETEIFTAALSETDEDWRMNYDSFNDPVFVTGLCCNSTTWPENGVDFFGYSVTGVVGIVLSIPYTLGYTALPNAIKNELPFAALINSQNKITTPSLQSMQAAITGINSNVTDDEIKDAYPVASFIYVAANSSGHPDVNCYQMREFVAFIDWLLFTVNDSTVNQFGLVKLDQSTALDIRRNVLQAFTCNGKSSFEAYLHTFDRPIAATDAKYIALIAVAGIVLIALIFAALAYILITKRQLEAQDSKWLIPLGIVQIKNRSNSNYNVIYRGNGVLPPIPPTPIITTHNNDYVASTPVSYHHLKHVLLVGKYNDSTVYLDRLYKFPHPTDWKINTKKLMRKFTEDFIHNNILHLRGVTLIDTLPYAVCEASPKGSLHYVLQTCKYELTDTVKYNLSSDITEGLKFLHSKNIVHGLLSSITCYVETSWTVKIGQWYRGNLYSVEGVSEIKSLLPSYHYDNVLDAKEIISLIYVDPESYPNFTYASDIYSFGSLLLEIFTKQLPYHEEVERGHVTFHEIFRSKFFDKQIIKPSVSDVIPSRIKDIIESTWLPISRRPDIRQISHKAKKVKTNSKGIVDAMMDIIENYAENLEQKTNQLQQVTEKMKDLLHEVLPPTIAEKMFNGETVSPEYFDNATVCFADIVGFTVISAKSTPHEVMSFLNDIWTLFDSIIQKFDVYKVDTIGDAYMVCSGLPQRNGVAHCRNIASLALALLYECENFKIYHAPEEKLEIRVGFNTGPVTAGIVGSKMPQYCVFGDTVNTAARMQSTSLPMKIQLSENSADLLRSKFTSFVLEFRGEINVKGKGLMKTYWLTKQNSVKLRH